jgi:hypothetical protein
MLQEGKVWMEGVWMEGVWMEGLWVEGGGVSEGGVAEGGVTVPGLMEGEKGETRRTASAKTEPEKNN